MIVIGAQCWPRGSQLESIELLHVSITNNSSIEDKVQTHFAHVLARPNPFTGVVGYEADVEIHGHEDTKGLTPLLIAALGAAYAADPNSGLALPATRLLARTGLQDIAAFQQSLKGRR